MSSVVICIRDPDSDNEFVTFGDVKVLDIDRMGTELATTEEALLAVGREGGVESVALLGALMDKNHRDLEATFESLYEGERKAHEATQARLDAALDRLARIEDRVWNFLS